MISLELSYCYNLQNVDNLVNLTKMTSLNLCNCLNLQNVDGISKLTNLTYLNLRQCQNLQNVNGISNLTKLIELYLDNDRVNDIKDVFTKLKSLRKLHLTDFAYDLYNYTFEKIAEKLVHHVC